MFFDNSGLLGAEAQMLGTIDTTIDALAIVQKRLDLVLGRTYVGATATDAAVRNTVREGDGAGVANVSMKGREMEKEGEISVMSFEML